MDECKPLGGGGPRVGIRTASAASASASTATTPAAATTPADDHGGRGLHSSTSQLILSRF